MGVLRGDFSKFDLHELDTFLLSSKSMENPLVENPQKSKEPRNFVLAMSLVKL